MKWDQSKFRTEYVDDDYAIENGIEGEIEHDNNMQLLSSETKECDDKARGQDYYKRWVKSSAECVSS